MNQSGIETEYKLLRKIRSVIDEINILQPVFDEQHSMTRRLLKWVDIQTENRRKENAPNGRGNGNGNVNVNHSHNDNGNGNGSVHGNCNCNYLEQTGRANFDKGANGLQKWEDFAVSDQTDIIKQRVQWLEKDAQRVLNSVQSSPTQRYMEFANTFSRSTLFST